MNKYNKGRISREVSKIFRGLAGKPLGNNSKDIYGYKGDIHEIGTEKKESAWEVKRGWLVDHDCIDPNINYLDKYKEEMAKDAADFDIYCDDEEISGIRCWFCESNKQKSERNFCPECKSYKCCNCGSCDCIF